MLRREIRLRNPLVVNGYHLRISSEGSPYFGLQLRANCPFPVLKKYTKLSARILIVQGVRLAAGEGGAQDGRYSSQLSGCAAEAKDFMCTSLSLVICGVTPLDT